MEHTENTLDGTVLEVLGGFYYVYISELNRSIESRARGNFRNSNIKPVVGDYVSIRYDKSTDKGYIVEVSDRKSQLVRPPVANIDYCFVFLSCKNPQIKDELLLKFVLNVYLKCIQPVVIVTKVDLITKSERNILLEKMRVLENLNIDVHYVEQLNQVSTHRGITDLYKSKTGQPHILAFAGQTGVGKTTFLNYLGYSEQTQDVSKALGRGKHTTRASTIYLYDPLLWIIDTPGFSSFQLESDAEMEIANAFQTLLSIEENCKFRTCLHISEPSCAVKKCVDTDDAYRWLYDAYLKILKEVKQNGKY